MAKDAILTVKVEAGDYEKFAKSFTDLSDRVKEMTKTFSDIGKSAQKAGQQTQQMNTMMQNLLQTSGRVHSTVKNITDHFGRWAVLIGGVTMMLGTGAGLFGFDRLANRIMQNRRQALGLGMGSDLAGMQAAQIAMTGTPGGANVMGNISGGLYGDVSKMRVLNRLGVPYGSQMSPKEALDQVLKVLPEQMKDVPRERLLQWAEARGYRQFFGDEFLLAHHGREGRKLAEREREDLKNQPAPMSKEALDNWNKFSRAVARFTTELENRLGEKLSGVAESLTHLSGALTKVIETLLNWPIVKSVLDKIAGWLDSFATFLEKDSTIKALEAFGNFFSQTLKDQFNMFINDLTGLKESIKNTLQTIGDIISWIWNHIPGIKKLEAPPMTNDPYTGLPYPIVPGKQSWMPGTDNFSSVTGGRTNFAAYGAGRNTNVAAYGGVGGRTSLASFGGNTNSVASFLGGNQSSYASLGGGGGGVRLAGRGGGAGGGGGRTLVASAGGRSGGFSTFGTAAQRATPGGDSFGFANTQLASLNAFGGGRGGRMMRGAQDVGNWQMNRTASITVRDVPSANIYATAAGMVA